MQGVTVFVVDDEQAMRDSLTQLLESEGFRVVTFTDAEHFLQQHDRSREGVLLLDIKMPGMDGLELQERLQTMGIRLPVIMITGHGNVPMSVRAIKNGAVDFIEKPFRAQKLLDQIDAAVQRAEAETERLAAVYETQDRMTKLTPREREIMELVVDGSNSREIAEDLEISEKTVALHRAHFMKKLQAGCVADLVRMAMEVRQQA